MVWAATPVRGCARQTLPYNTTQLQQNGRVGIGFDCSAPPRLHRNLLERLKEGKTPLGLRFRPRAYAIRPDFVGHCIQVKSSRINSGYSVLVCTFLTVFRLSVVRYSVVVLASPRLLVVGFLALTKT